MGRFIKVTLISFGISLILGLVLLFGGMAAGGTQIFKTFVANDGLAINMNNLSNWWFWGSDVSSDEDFHQDIVNLDASIKKISIDDFSLGEIIFETGEGNSIRVFSKNTEGGYTCRQEGETLNITYSMSGDFIKKMNRMKKHPVVKIQLPKDYMLDDCDIDLDAGSIRIEEINSRELSVLTDAGSVEIDKASADSADFEVNAGEIRLRQYDGGDVDLTCEMGAIYFAGNVDGNIDAECDMGQIDFDLKGNSTKYTYNLDATLGQVICNGKSISGISSSMNKENNSAYYLTAECNMGQINIKTEE